jgi:hypothetical protein
MDILKEKIRNFSSQLKNRLDQIKGEEVTKHACVLPLIQILGYDIWNPLEVRPEYTSDFITKSKPGPAEKIDYCLCINKEPSIFIECKALSENLSKYTGQLSRYFNASPCVRVAVLTNGTTYNFYTDLKTPNILDDTPFFTWSLDDLSDDSLDQLMFFSRETFNKDLVKTVAENTTTKKVIEQYLGELFKNPSENFIKFLLSELKLVQRCTDKVVDKYRDVVKNILCKEGDSSLEKPGSKIVTTEEELQIFTIVSSLCNSSDITYKDTINYFAISTDSNSKNWFMKAYCNWEKKFVVLRLPEKEEFLKSLELYETERVKDTLKIYFEKASDIKFMRDLILGAFSYTKDLKNK